MTSRYDRPASRFDDALYPRRPMAHPPVKTATRLREFLQWVFVCLIALTLMTVDQLPAWQVQVLAAAYFGWAALYGAAMYWESRA